jgi:ATP-binding cassette, subfamily B, bacterial
VLFALYVRQLQAPFSSVVGLRYPAIRAGIAFTRVYDVLEAEVAADERGSSSTEPLVGRPAVLRLEGVSYSYPATDEVSIPGLSRTGQAVGVGWTPLVGLRADDAAPRSNRRRRILDDVSFELGAGRHLALVGESGAGKSTIAHLAIGLLLPDDGRVLLNGVDTRLLSYKELAGVIGYIAQDTYVLHEKVRENLLYAHVDATRADLDAALRVARFDRVVDRLPDGMETVIGEKGHRLSGGERQRLSIARAVLRRPQLVVLDEPRSQLDAATESEIKVALSEALFETAVLTIAHRLSTVIDADQILVLDGGTIVESGTHDAPILRGGRYSELYRTQLGAAMGHQG